MAKFFINNTAKALPSTIHILERKKQKGNKLYSIWYGYYDLGTSFCKRIKLYLTNG